MEKHKATSDKLELKASLYDTAGQQVAQRRVRVADGQEGIAKQSLDLKAVSYTHLDVYKRQARIRCRTNNRDCRVPNRR